MAEPSAMNCPGCGAPLRPEARAARVTCSHCGTVSEIATEGALQVARVLEKHGIRMPERPMSVDDIRAGFAERAAEEAMRLQTARIVAAVVLVVAAVIVGIGLFVGSR